MEKIFDEIKRELGFEFPESAVFKKAGGGLKVARANGKITVSYTEISGIFRAALILKAMGGEDFEVEEKRAAKELCLMIDCSRNAVKNAETVKKLIRIIAAAGYTSLMLYTEDTFEVDNEPMFGYLRGKYTKAEMKELDAYAADLGIELIPCIQTLAHFNQLKRYQYSHFKCFDCSDILLAGENRTYELIENIFKTLRECYKTEKIHIGMDEAWLLGRGRYLDKNGYRDPFDIILGHLKKVCEIAGKYNFKPIMWSDMFWRIAYADENCKDENGKVKIPEKVLSEIPADVALCHWDYHCLKSEDYYEKLEIHTQFKNDIWFAGGTAEDNRGVLPHLSYSLKVSAAAIEASKKFQPVALMETVWGDNGGECAVMANLPAIVHYASCAIGVSDERMKKEFLALTGVRFDDFMKLEYAQTFGGKYTKEIANPAKYGLYNDVFSGYADAVIDGGDKKYFSAAKRAIEGMENGEYGYLFRTAISLNEVLALKYDVGIRLRNAYRKKDKEELKILAETLGKIEEKIGAFIKDYRKQWLKENKPQGLEIQEIRLGGLKERIKGCRERLEEYLGGESEIIPELEEKLLPAAVSRMRNPGRCDLFSHEAIASVNAFDGFTEVDV